jgi:hypothetical protein
MVFAIHGLGRGILILIGLPVVLVGGTLFFAWMIGITGLLKDHPGWSFFLSVLTLSISLHFIGQLEDRLRKTGFFEKMRNQWHSSRDD